MNTYHKLMLVVMCSAGISCKKQLVDVQGSQSVKQTASAQLTLYGGNRWDKLAVPNIVPPHPSAALFNMSFAANDKLYAIPISYNQLWQYDPAVAAWSQLSSAFFPADMYSGEHTGYGYVFSNGNFVYFLNPVTKSLKQYNFTTGKWADRASFPGTALKGYSTACTTAKGYVLGGANGRDAKGYDFVLSENWEYDFAGDSWTAKAATPGPARSNAAAFAVGDKLYFGTGISIRLVFDAVHFTAYREPVINADWYEYATSGNTWIKKADFGGGTRQDTRGFVCNGTVYLGMGSAGYYDDLRADIWSYDAIANSWTMRAPFPEGNVYPPYNSMTGAAGKGYAVNGLVTDFWQYTPPFRIL